MFEDASEICSFYVMSMASHHSDNKIRANQLKQYQMTKSRTN
jgi:hypothetical protein